MYDKVTKLKIQILGKSTEGLLTLDVAPRLFLGGLPDMSEILERSGGEGGGATLSRYRGCMRSLYINEASYPLKAIKGRTGANIVDCDGTVCGGEVCHNDGVCVLDQEDSGPGYHCQCQASYTGHHCQVHSLCQNNPCKNKAKCKVNINGHTDFVCDCPLGYQGRTCEARIDVEVPHFSGHSYLQYTMEDEDSVRHTTDIEMEIMVDNTDGMIVWIGVDPTADDYLGLGLEDGLVKVVWNLGWFSRTELVIPDLNVTDSSWHRISLSRYVSTEQMTISKHHQYSDWVRTWT